MRRLPCGSSDVAPHVDAAHESSTLISGTDSLDLSLSMMPDGKSELCFFTVVEFYAVCLI